MTIATAQNIDPADFINSTEVDGTPTKDNGRVAKLETVQFTPRRIHHDFLSPRAMVNNFFQTSAKSPAAADLINLGFVSREVTFQQLNAVIQGSSTPGVLWGLMHGASFASGDPIIPFQFTSNTTTGDEITPAALKALDLESGSTQYASITDAAQTGLDLTTDFTFEGWVKIESLASNMAVISKGDVNAEATRQYVLEIDSSGNIRLWTSNGTSTAILTSTSTLSTGQWYHIAVAYDVSAGQAFFYIDGQLDNSPTGGKTTLNTTSEPFYIGGRKNTTVGQTFDGIIRNVRVWSDIRTQSEIQANIDTTLAGSEGNLVGAWMFDDDYIDLTSNNNDLTASGSPTFVTAINPVVSADEWVWIEVKEVDGTVTLLAVTADHYYSST